MDREANVRTVKSYLDAITRFDVEAAKQLLDPGVVQMEHPNRLYAKGQVRDFAQLTEDLPKGRAILSEQQYEIRSILADGDRVAVEARWRGVLNIPIRAMAAGNEMIAHVAMIFTLRDGRIVSQANYDCYEAFDVA